MIKGTYSIFINGNKVSESSNAITTQGMNIIRSYLANPSYSWSGAISIGCLNTTAASSTNTSMDFEITKVPVLLRSVDNSEIVLKSTLEADIECQIYEIGLYPSVFNNTSNGYDDKIIVNFDEEWFDSSTLLEINNANYSSSSRVGSRSIIIPQTVIDFSYDLSFDLTGYSSLDEISFLYNVTSTGSDRTITVTLHDNQLPTAGTKSANIVLDGSSTGYKKVSELLGNLSELNNFNGSISKISISTLEDLTASELNIDSIRINDSDEVDPNFSLVSRSLIGVVSGESSSDYVSKPLGIEADIEYRLEIS